MAGKAGIHQTQAVQQFRSGAERAADTRHSRPLVQCQRCRYIQHLIHSSLRRLRHSSARIGRQRLQIPPGAFCIQHAKRQRGFSRAGDAGDRDDFVQRNVHVYIFQIVHFCAPYEHFIDHGFTHPVPEFAAAIVKRKTKPLFGLTRGFNRKRALCQAKKFINEKQTTPIKAVSSAFYTERNAFYAFRRKDARIRFY